MSEAIRVDRGPRLAAVDAVRGAAVLAMVVYHFAWDLSARGLIEVDVVRDPLWRGFARSIAGTFLVLVGVGLVLAIRNGIRWRPYLRRLALIVGAAGLVSAATYWSEPSTFVYFGILHMIAAGSIVTLPFLALPSWLVGAAALAALAAPDFLTGPAFDAPFWWWLGLTVHPRPSVDYVPVLPWLAPILAGLLVGRLIREREGGAFAAWRRKGPAEKIAVLAGRWSLLIYLLHQPLLVGALDVLQPYLPAREAAFERVFQRDCSASCRQTGADMPVCELFCGCIVAGFRGTPLMHATDIAALSPADQAQRETVLEICRKKVTDPGSPDASRDRP
jgi:uncharacterized membrane protein